MSAQLEVLRRIEADVRKPSAREIEVFSLIEKGMTNAEIGRALWLSAETIKSHVRHVLAKTGCVNRSQALALLIRRGWV